MCACCPLMIRRCPGRPQGSAWRSRPAAVEVEGTSLAKMAERARDRVRFLLRAVRIAESGRVHHFQLRFRIGIGYAFDDRLQGWNRRSDDAYELTLTEQGVKELFGHPALSSRCQGAATSRRRLRSRWTGWSGPA